MATKIALTWFPQWVDSIKNLWLSLVDLQDETSKRLWGMDKNTYQQKNGVDLLRAREAEALYLFSQRCKWDVILTLDKWVLEGDESYAKYNLSTLKAFWYNIIDVTWMNAQEVWIIVENIFNTLHIVIAWGQGVWKSTTWIILSELISVLSNYFSESSIGKMFPDWSWDFFDVDDEIVDRELDWEKIKDFQTRKSEAWENWEEDFRPKEWKVWSDLIYSRKPSIIATGWWTLTFDNNRRIVLGDEMIDQKAIVVYLWADVKTRMSRIMWDKKGNKNRGTVLENSEWLSGWDAKASELDKLAPVREPLMYAIADIIIDTRGKLPAEVAMEIIELVNA